MPLSDEEMRLLAQMERALVEEDPKFASTLRGSRMAQAAQSLIVLSAVVFVAGMAMLLGGVVARQTWLGVLGFVVMLASATFGLNAVRRRRYAAEHAHDEAPGHPSMERGSHPAPGSFMDRLEQRWHHRRPDEDD